MSAVRVQSATIQGSLLYVGRLPDQRAKFRTFGEELG